MNLMEVRMRTTALVVVILTALAATARAQDTTAQCHPVSPTERVVVTTNGGGKLRGTLLCLTDRELVLAANGQSVRTPLDMVRTVTTQADPIWDGAAKGAVVPLVIWAVFCHECAAEPMLRTTLAY